MLVDVKVKEYVVVIRVFGFINKMIIVFFWRVIEDKFFGIFDMNVKYIFMRDILKIWSEDVLVLFIGEIFFFNDILVN